jgi:3-methyl-2-oxobutanoate hydroxymethyltransferase
VRTINANPITVSSLDRLKGRGQKITCLTAYDYSFSALLDRAGIDMIMVGDSLGMVMQGHDTPLPVTLEDSVYHTACVARGCDRALIIGDLPFGTFQLGPEQACESAVVLMQEGGAQVVKLEGGVHMAETIGFLTARGIPVCAHIGLTPQSVHRFGGFKVQGRTSEAAKQLREDAAAVEAAGASMVVIEAVPATLAQEITASLSIPSIGIGAGPACDGQVLVLQDVIGIYPKVSPKFCKNFMDEADTVEGAIVAYIDAVRSGRFPTAEHCFD